MFINEIYSQEDCDKYNIREIQSKYIAGACGSEQWTVDKENEIFLMQLTSGREEFQRDSQWCFLFEKKVYVLDIHTDRSDKLDDGSKISYKTVKRVSSLGDRFFEPSIDDYACIIPHVREAFNAYKGGGVYSRSDNYRHDITFAC